MVQQFLHGTQYIDELVMVRVAGKGEVYVHQDANWNVIGTSDLGGRVVESLTRYSPQSGGPPRADASYARSSVSRILSPYGQLTVFQETGFGDRDGDGIVDATDKGTPGTTCSGVSLSGACRILDLDFDGNYDSADATLFDALPQGYMAKPGLLATATNQPFAHQGLLFEPEIRTYQNRARQYDPGKRRFAQRDPLGYVDSLNDFSRSGMSPLMLVDPSGWRILLENNTDEEIDFFKKWLGEICPDCGIDIVGGGQVVATTTPAQDEFGQWLIGIITNPILNLWLKYNPTVEGTSEAIAPTQFRITIGALDFGLDGPNCSECVYPRPDATIVHEISHCPPFVKVPSTPASDTAVDTENDYRRSRNLPVRSGCDHPPAHSCCDANGCCPNPP